MMVDHLRKRADFEADILIFKDWIDSFLKICNASIGNTGISSKGNVIKNKVENGTRKGEVLSNGLRLWRKFAFGTNSLNPYPYINIGWANIFYDWKEQLFSPRKLILSTFAIEFLGKPFPAEKSLTIGTNSATCYISEYALTEDFTALRNANDYRQLLQEFIHLYEKINQEGRSDMKCQELVAELKASANLILRGAPGTGKTYLAKKIAANIISEGAVTEIESLTADQRLQFQFVQFHPCYDYTDFVEGLRPISKEGQVGFKPQDGIFKAFCKRAALCDTLEKGYQELFKDIQAGKVKKIGEITDLKIGDTSIHEIIGKHHDSILDNNKTAKYTLERLEKAKNGGTDYGRSEMIEYIEKTYIKKYVFIIDEINRCEISKVFGELFFSIDPEYRGEKGAVSTQYSALFQSEGLEEGGYQFYIPSNVFIIGTMNDIDRSVDTFDFAMRRRFLFEEITAEDSQVMLSNESVKARMNRLNKAIVENEQGGLSEDYQIGASYFKKLDEAENDEEVAENLWEKRLEPLLNDYFRGERNKQTKLQLLKIAYGPLGDDESGEESEG